MIQIVSFSLRQPASLAAALVQGPAMKKSFPCVLALCVCTGAQAFPGNVNLSKTEGMVKRTLALSNWSVDKRGVPSFDYRYRQSGAECDYERTGRAIAGFDGDGEQVELQVYSGQDENGEEGPDLTIFYDHDDDVVFSMALSEQSAPDWVSFEDAAMKKKFPGQCGFTADESAAIFKK